jgi:hypothetical protein
MAEISYRDLFWQVRTELPGVPEPTLFMFYAAAVREHLRRSLAWQYNAGLTQWTLTDNFPDASAALPTLTAIVQPVQVKWSNGVIIPFKTRAELDEIDGDWEQSTTAGLEPDFWTITSPGNFALIPDSSTTVVAAVELRLAIVPLLPTSAADNRVGVPEELALEFSEDWAHGALAKMMRIPGKDWTNFESASSYAAIFENDIKVAKARAGADFGRPRRRVRYGGLGIGGAQGRLPNSKDDYGNIR